MADAMRFPDTVEKFMESYKMVDEDHVYSNGTEYVPIFRMQQWFEHERLTNHWISVDERLPEYDGLYLVIVKTAVSYMRTIVQFVHSDWILNFDVIYWMPLPELPEELIFREKIHPFNDTKS